ncbi:MAG TPA: ATP-binding protein [Actinomycetota bacterium]|nr:ATP-binding protein [Actinomycetota bacterium]
MDGWAIAATAAALAAAVAAIVGWRRASRSSAAWHARALTAQATLDEDRRRADEERSGRDLVLSTMQDGILLIAGDGSVAFTNEAVSRHLASVPTSLTSILPLALRGAIEECRARGTPIAVEIETGVPARWLNVAITPATDGATLVVVRDVTERRRLEAMRRDFVANASHELKTPAATIQAAAETLGHAARDDPAAVPRFAGQLEREAVRLSRIVQDLLDLSRLETGSALAEVVSLGATAREEAQRLNEAADRAGVTVEVRAADQPDVRGSHRDLALLLRNLIDNAIRYSHEGGKVTVDVERVDGGVELAVGDTGIGIPSRETSRVFERFYRVDRARARETGGTGLGLAIVKHVVENHGGTIEVESELGLGTTFRVRLPVAGRTSPPSG